MPYDAKVETSRLHPTHVSTQDLVCRSNTVVCMSHTPDLVGLPFLRAFHRLAQIGWAETMFTTVSINATLYPLLRSCTSFMIEDVDFHLKFSKNNL